MNYILLEGLPLLGGLARSHLVQHFPLAKDAFPQGILTAQGSPGDAEFSGGG